MLSRRKEVVGELQLEWDTSSPEYTPVEVPGAMGASRVPCVPALLRCSLDLLALGGPASDEQGQGDQCDGQYVYSIG